MADGKKEPSFLTRITYMLTNTYISRGMRFPTMWYVRPAKSQGLCLSLEYSISVTVKLLNEDHLEFLSLKGDCTCSYESTLVKMPHCLKAHVTVQLL